MATNATDHLINSTQPGLSSVCSIMGIFAWQEQYLTPTAFIMYVFAASVEALLCPSIILLNALVILAVKRKRYLRKKKPCVLLASLAATDLLLGLVVLPVLIMNDLQRILGVGPICLIGKMVEVIMEIVCGASFWHLVIISGERYIAIKHALRYETLVTTRRLTTVVVVVWTFSVIPCLVSLAFDLAGESVLRDHLNGVVLLIFVFGGVLVVSFCQFAVLLEAKRHREHIKAMQVSESSAKELLQKDKAVRTTTIIVGTMFVCYIPLLIFYAVATSVSNFPASMLLSVAPVLDLFVIFNSFINPIIYCMRTQEFKRAFSELFNPEVSQINAHFAMNTVGSSREQRKDDKVCMDPSNERKQVAWPDTTSLRGSRSRSLDLSKDSSHAPMTRRTNSV